MGKKQPCELLWRLLTVLAWQRGSHYTHPFPPHCLVTDMGLTVSSIWNSLASLTRWTKEKDVRILMLGLDSAGKVRVAHEWSAQLGNSATDISGADDDTVQVTGTLLPIRWKQDD